MKIDNNPLENRNRFEEFRVFSAKSMLITRKGFWLFFGFTFVIASPFVFFGKPSSVFGSAKVEAGLKSFGLGLTIILVTLIVSYLLGKIGEYNPEKNNGDEWLQ